MEKLVNMKKSSGNGLGLTSILFLIFLTLKLTNNIDWSWWWVTSPIWIPLGIILIVFLVSFFIFLIWGIILLIKGVPGEEISKKFNDMAKKSPLK